MSQLHAGRYDGKERTSKAGLPESLTFATYFDGVGVMVREYRVLSSVEREDNGTDPSGYGGCGVKVPKPWLLVDTLYMQRIRTRADFEVLLLLFKKAVLESFTALDPVDGECGQKEGRARMGRWFSSGRIGIYPSRKTTPEWLQIGETVLRRGCWTEGAGHIPARVPVAVMCTFDGETRLMSMRTQLDP